MTEYFEEAVQQVTSGIQLTNGAICVDSLGTTGRAAVNFMSASNKVARVFFGASCVCGLISATSSGVAMGSRYYTVPMAGWLGSLSARGFNRLGKYTLKMGAALNGEMTNVVEISELMN